MGLDDQKHKDSEYRIRFGPIDAPEELLAIKGSEKKTLEKKRAKIITRRIQPPKPTNPVRGLDEIRQIITVRGHPEFRDSSVGRAEDC